MDRKATFNWSAHEHEHREKSSDWFWALGIIAIAAAATAVIFENVLFAIVIVVAAFATALIAAKPSGLFVFTINTRGVRINNKLYPYQTLDSFWISDEEEDREPKLLIKSDRVLMPLLVIPLAETPPEELRDFLLGLLDEKEMHEPFSQRILEFFGF